MSAHFAVLGDIHGKFDEVGKAIRRHPDIPVLSVGDMGFGFPHYKRWRRAWIPDPTGKDPSEFPANFSFIRGNHDAPAVCRAHPNYLGDYGIDPETGIFFVSGAKSIDRDDRVEGVDWWPDEELTIAQFNAAIDLFEKTRPQIVMSHDAPLAVMQHLKSHHVYDKSRTQQGLQGMLEVHRPALWCFGHHHCVWEKKINGTLFVCVAINQVKKFKL